MVGWTNPLCIRLPETFPVELVELSFEMEAIRGVELYYVIIGHPDVDPIIGRDHTSQSAYERAIIWINFREPSGVRFVADMETGVLYIIATNGH